MSLNVGRPTTAGKSRELADTMTKRDIGMTCFHDARWKGAKVCEIGSLTYINYWTKHASNDPSAEMQGAAVTCYIPTGRCHDPDMLQISTIN